MTTTDAPARTDKYGFPVELCNRCAGHGDYPSSAWGGVCLGCNGSGFAWASRTIANHAHRFITAFKAAGHAVTMELQPGMRVWLAGSDAFREVTAVSATDQVDGVMTVGAGDNATVTTYYAHDVTFTDGVTQRHNSRLVWTVQRDPQLWEARRWQAVADALDAEARNAVKREKAAAKRAVQGAEKRDAQQAAWSNWSAGHAELVAALEPLSLAHGCDSSVDRVLRDLADHVHYHHPLTDKQVALARRLLDEAAQREQQRYAGDVGQVVTVTGTIARRWRFEGAYGWSTGTVIEGTGDDQGITVVTFSGNAALLDAGRGDAVTLTGQVRKCATRDGVTQTTLGGRVTARRA